jgi:hypothetical protein
MLLRGPLLQGGRPVEGGRRRLLYVQLQERPAVLRTDALPHHQLPQPHQEERRLLCFVLQ